MHENLPLDPTPHTQRSLTRRRFLASATKVVGSLAAFAAAPELLAACSSSSTPAKKPSTTSKAHLTAMNLQLSWVPDVEFAGAFLAKEDGYYAKHGLDVSFLPGGPSVSVEPVVVAGHAFVGDSQVAQGALAVAHGAPLKIIGAKYQKNPLCLISPLDSPIDTPQDMIGKKIGVSSVNLPPFKTLLTLNKIDISKITVVPVGFDPTPLADGEVQGWVGFITDEPIALELKGFKTHTFLFYDFGYKLFGDIYEATVDSLATKKEELAAFMAAQREGWTKDVNDPSAGLAAAKPYFTHYGLAEQLEDLENKAQIKLIDTGYAKTAGFLAMSEEDIKGNIATLAAAGMHLSASELFDTSVLAML